MNTHRVRQGESIFSLSKRYGVPADKILNHPDNRQYQDSGRSSGILYPGDIVSIPDPEIKEVELATNQRHTFSCLNRSVELKMRFLKRDEPLADEPYLLRVTGDEISGNLDRDGWLREQVPADAADAVLVLGEGDSQRKINLRIGDLNPAQEAGGICQRLHNLGFFHSEEDLESERVDPDALRTFQAKHGIEETGQLDEDTRNRIIEAYGC